MKTTTTLLLISALFLILGPTPYKPTSSSPLNLSVSEVENQLGLVLHEKAYNWEVPAAIGKQTAWQILVASTKQRLDADVGDIWDSGKRYSAGNKEVRHAGLAFESGQKVWWKVRIWDENDVAGSYSAAETFQIQAGEEVSNNIVLVGGTLISSMEKYGYLETAITLNWPHHDIRFRNLGWPGDDVVGTARSEFGSAHNTRSWQPPNAKEGFGYEVLMGQVERANPTTLIIGYGAEAAFVKSEAEFEQFTKNYEGLIKALEPKAKKLILLTPHRQQQLTPDFPDPATRNEYLKRASAFIHSLSSQRGYQAIDLFESLIPADNHMNFTADGMHLNGSGYHKMSEIILRKSGLSNDKRVRLKFDVNGKAQISENGTISNFVKTGRGFRFDLQTDRLSHLAHISIQKDHLLKIDGEIHRKRSDVPDVESIPDLEQISTLRQTIIEKNRLHRYRINPLNKAYIFLFRRHEMGHLAYEMDDFDRLVEEQEELIARLKTPRSHRFEVEILEPWKSPRDYPEHEVPKNIPEPNIQAELDAFTLSDELEVNLFASDPMIANPMYMTWDTRGRAWVSTSTIYPHIKPGQELSDKIVILEDTDQDGVADKSTVFAEGLLIPHSVMPVKGGAYVLSTTEMLFFADHNDDGVADEKHVVFAGFGNADVHHTIHGFRWAPSGDLYFTQSIYINSFVETLYGPRRLNGSGIWRFRPENGKLDVFSRGIVNPWGHTFDDWGQAFATDGAGGSGPNYIFPGSAHISAVGTDRILPGLLSGKPKNTAAEFITGRHMPEQWLGSLIANDYRANRTVRYKITEKGSGYAAEEVETIIKSGHRSFRPVDIKMGPEGAMYVVDWYSPIIDHGEVDFHHPSRDKSHGRIWRITAKNRPLVKRPTIYGSSTEELLDLLKSPEQLTRMLANRALVESGCKAEDIAQWVAKLNPQEAGFEHHRLEALWLHAAINVPNEDLLGLVLNANDHRARAAAVRMLAHWQDQIPTEALLERMISDPHPQVRLEAVHALRQQQTLEAVNIAMRALDQPVDEFLDFALWQTANQSQHLWMPLLKSGKKVFDGNFERTVFALKAANNSEAVAQLARFIERDKLNGEEKAEILGLMAAKGGPEELDIVLREAVTNSDVDLLEALANAPSTQKSIPRNTKALSNLFEHTDEKIRILAAQLAGRWKPEINYSPLADMAKSEEASLDERLAAAEALMSLDASNQIIEIATNDRTSPAIKATAIAAWAKTHPREAILPAVDLLTQMKACDESDLLIRTFTRQEGGQELLAKALEGKSLDNELAVNALRIARSSGRNMEALTAVITKAGKVQAVGMKMTPELRASILTEVEEKGSAGRGRQIYYRKDLLCTTCHQVDNVGGKLGPDLTTLGTYMTPGSILESLINPNSDIKQGYETVIVRRKDGSIVSGTLDRKTESAALIRTAAGDVVSVPNEEIEKLDSSPVSLMPPGLTARLRQDELVDLMKYLTELGK